MCFCFNVFSREKKMHCMTRATERSCNRNSRPSQPICNNSITATYYSVQTKHSNQGATSCRGFPTRPENLQRRPAGRPVRPPPLQRGPSLAVRLASTSISRFSHVAGAWTWTCRLEQRKRTPARIKPAGHHHRRRSPPCGFRLADYSSTARPRLRPPGPPPELGVHSYHIPSVAQHVLAPALLHI